MTPHPAATGSQAAATAGQQRAAAQTRDEHDALVRAMHELEAALARPAPGREGAWNEHVVDKLRGVAGLLAEHVRSAESEDGLLAVIDLRFVSRLRREHGMLARQAGALRDRIEHHPEGTSIDVTDVRQRATRLLSALRRHQAAETDMVFESLFIDLGGGD